VTAELASPRPDDFRSDRAKAEQEPAGEPAPVRCSWGVGRSRTRTHGRGRLKGKQAQLLHHFIDVGEYGLALEEISGALAQDTIAITGQERSDMLALSRQMKTGDIVPRALGFCPQAT
jgi:hypothetical protein